MHMASSAPMLHLKSIIQMTKLELIMLELATVVIGSISLHLWYLSPQSIPLALAEESLSTQQKTSLALGLSQVSRTQNVAQGKPSFPDLSELYDSL